VRFVPFVFKFLACFSTFTRGEIWSARFATMTFGRVRPMVKNQAKDLMLAHMG
jgi:hypothetical protein